MGDGYIGLKNAIVAADRMAGTIVIVCAALVSLWLVNQATQMWPENPSAMASSAPDAPHGTHVATGPLTALDLRKLQSKLEGLGFQPGVIDGIAGGRTLDALNRYREARMLKRVYEIEYATVGGLLD
jgi:lysozyme family protein